MKSILRILSIIAICNLQFSFCNSQSLSPKALPANGGYATGGGNSLSFSIGETFNTTFVNGSTVLSQGEQQPEIDLYAGAASTTALCAGSSFTLPYTATGYYGAGNIFTAQLSNAAGSFSSPVTIGSLANTVSGTITATIPIITTTGSNYRIRVVSNHPDYIGKMSSSILIISTTPPVGTVHITAAPAAGCVGGSDVVSVNAVTGATFYNWTCSQRGILFNGNAGPYQSSSPTVSISFTSLPSAGSSGWSICAFAGNLCGNSNTTCTWIRSTVSKPSSINGSVIGCPNTNGNAYSVSAVSGASNYIWSSSAGITVIGSGQNITVNFSAAFTSGTLCVHSQTSCGYNSADYCMTISKAPATPGVISGVSYVCPNASTSFSVTAVANAASYTWTCSVPGSTIIPNGASCSILFPATIPAVSTVCVTANSSCGNASITRCKGIASGLPNTPGNISGLSSGQCGASGVSYSITPVNLATGYLWTASNGATISGPNNLSGVSVNFPASFTSSTLSVKATNSCGQGAARTLAVTAAPSTPPAISGNTSVCNGAVETYTTLGSAGATSYAWTVPAGAVILGPSNGASILVQCSATGGTLICKASNTCGISGSRTLAVVVTCRESQIQNSTSNFNAEIFPNPATEKATLKLTAASSGKYHLNMTDVLGRNVLSTDGASTEGINMIELNLGPVAKGVYLLNIMSGDNTEQIRVVVE